MLEIINVNYNFLYKYFKTKVILQSD